MLLGHVLLSPRAAEVWRVRERTEHEAAAIFARLAKDLRAAGAPPQLVELAGRCAEDETVHAAHCRRIVEELSPGLPPLAPDLDVVLGEGTDPARRALYTSVALGCITESLSTALLLEMRPHAKPGAVREGLDRIVSDEVRHSRLGWAYLAYEAERGAVDWLAPSIPAMLEAALDTELGPTSGEDLRAYGILPPDDVRRICEATIETTIVPGLARFGIEVA